MVEIDADPMTLNDAIKQASPGDVIRLLPGRYPPTTFLRLRGEPGRPIRVIGTAESVFDGGRRFEDVQLDYNRLARELKRANHYPGVHPIAHCGHVTMEGCRHVSLEGPAFEGCWPTGIALEHCQHIRLADLSIREGSFAIYATGAGTAHILVERCTWVQDIEERRIWLDIPWAKIHENEDVRDDDARAFDGDFFRAYGIKGHVTIRDCTISHAFNAIHFFHADQNGQDLEQNRSVRIYRNRFNFIRDNAIEPEWGAKDWWVFHNSIYNCHKAFSVEPNRMGMTYWFGNTLWFDSLPTPDHNQNGGAVWKAASNPRPAEGENALFHNSFFVRSKYIKKRYLRGIRHFHNAIQYCDPAHDPADTCSAVPSFFGKLNSTDPQKHFTKRWRDLDIRMFDDMCAHPMFPDGLRAAGYAIEGGWNDAPGFRDPRRGDFRLTEGAAARGKGGAVMLDLPDGTVWTLPEGLDLGAYQDEARLEPPPYAYSADGSAMT